MKPEFIFGNEKAEILAKLKKFGIEKIPFLLIKSGSERIRAYSGSMNIQELAKLSENVFVEIIGIYFARYDGEDLRLSVDALHLFKEQITKNIIDITDKQTDDYLKGKDIDIDAEQSKLFGEKRGYFVLRHNNDLLGMAKIVSGKFMKNYLPKERRRKN